MRRRRAPTPRRCLARGCGREIPAWQRLCTGCFRQLPFPQRRAIALAGQARDAAQVAQLAIEGANWLAANPPAAVAARRLGESEQEAAE